MAKTCIVRSSGLLSFLGMFNKEDVTLGETPTEQSDSFKKKQIKEAGMVRLKRMFTADEFGQLSPEINTVLQVGCMSIFVGALYGGIIESRTAYMNFFKNNQATIFKDHFEAKKRMQDKVTLSFAKGSYRWAWRLTFFTTTYVGISTAISVYRGKNGIFEHMIAGAVTGTTYKFNMGPKGWIVGGGLGLVLGLIAGGTTVGLLKLTGMTMEDTRHYNGKWKELRTSRYNEEVKKYLEKDQLEILSIHNERLGEDGKTLDNITK